MEDIIDNIEWLRGLSGNAQIDYLKEINSPLIREIMEYTYDPHKTYKIDKTKLNSIKIVKGLIPRIKKDFFTQQDWEKFTVYLNRLSNKRSASDEDVKTMKTFITDFNNEEVQNFLAMVLLKDLRLNMGIKKFQQVWPDFCWDIQVQLAEDFQDFSGTVFENGLYSRKFDGTRMFYHDRVAKSRQNIPCKIEPIKHIISQLQQCSGDMSFDGELLYFEEDGTENFKKTISLVRRDERDALCDNLYYVIFDTVSREEFQAQNSTMTTKDSYQKLLEEFDAHNSYKFGYSVLETKYPHILIARQETDSNMLMQLSKQHGWEGLMYRNADATYQFKRTSQILKIKEMKDGEFPLVGLLEGNGKNSGRLGSMVVYYKNGMVGVGSGFTDYERQLIWNNKHIFSSTPFVTTFNIKVQYFEETTNADGELSLRFPVFICFRHSQTGEEFTPFQVLNFCEERQKRK